MRIRRLCSLLHRYTGLALAALVGLAAVTGSLLVFTPELDRLLNPELLTIAPPRADAVPRPLAELLDTARRNHPAHQAVSITPPARPGDATAVWLKQPRAGEPGRFDWLQALFDPYSGRELGARERSHIDFSRTGLLHLVNHLHGQLLLGEFGLWLMAGAALAWSLTSLAGLYLWWPGRRKLRLALTVKRNAGTGRLLFDLHRAAGFYTLPVLLVLAVTGMYMARPATVKPVVGWFAPLDADKPPRVEPHPGQAPLTPDEAVATAQAALPQGALKRIGLPQSPRDTYAVSFLLPGEVRRPSGGRSTVWVDPWRGDALRVKDATRQPAGEAYLAWQTPLHSGSAFGLPGRLLVAAAGPLALLLAATGVLMWLRRGKKPKAAGQAVRPLETAAVKP